MERGVSELGTEGLGRFGLAEVGGKEHQMGRLSSHGHRAY